MPACSVPEPLKKLADEYASCRKRGIREGCQGTFTDGAKTLRPPVTHLGGGAFRQVYSFKGPRGKPCALKLAKDDPAWNQQEADAIATYPKLSHLLVPIHERHPDYWWLAVPRAVVHEDSKGREIVAKVDKELARQGYQCGDLKPANVGVLNGKPVLVDAGGFLGACNTARRVRALRSSGQLGLSQAMRPTLPALPRRPGHTRCPNCEARERERR